VARFNAGTTFFLMPKHTTDPRIKELVSEVTSGREAELVEEMIETALRFGRDHAEIADLKLYNKAMRELRYAASVFAKYHGISKVAVFGSARTKPETEEYQLARRFAARMVAEGYMLITGGGDGIMGAAQEGAGAQKSFGLNIRLPFEQKANEVIEGNPKLINFKYFFTRKLNFIKESQAFALFPGGFGTHDEGFELMTLIQTGKTPIVPIVMLDRPNGHYWEMWRRFISNDLLDAGLISKEDLNLFLITHDVESAVRHIRSFYRVFHSYRWVREKMVIRTKQSLSAESLEKLNFDFSHLLTTGKITQESALPQESDQPKIAHLPRLVLEPKKDFGKLRHLIDAINRAKVRS